MTTVNNIKTNAILAAALAAQQTAEEQLQAAYDAGNSVSQEEVAEKYTRLKDIRQLIDYCRDLIIEERVGVEIRDAAVATHTAQLSAILAGL